MKTSYFLGIDTSAYTSSIAVVDENNTLIADIREVLKVKKGSRGLRQQEAVFQHVSNLPIMIKKLSNEIDFTKVKTISSSVRPRNIDGSYMPVFKVAQGQGLILSEVLNVPYLEFSHQEGHIAAGFQGSEITKYIDKFLALHISGGTTELLYVNNIDDGYDIRVIGGTKDISAGQLVDRVGVKLEILFPCGKELESLSKNGEIIDSKMPISTDETWINFSGAETYFLRFIDENIYKSRNIAKSLFYTIGKSLSTIIERAIVKYRIHDILIIGGVASNVFIREIINDDILHKRIGRVYFPEPKYCTDNAIGIACLGSKNFKRVKT